MAHPNGNGTALEWSHDRVRTTVRSDEVTAPESAASVPIHAPGTTRFGKGNQAWRRRQLKQRAAGIATLNPAKVPTWMRPHVELGQPYIASLVALLADKPALHPLAGDCADAHVVYRALLTLAIATEESRTRAALLSEARGWLREHRTAMATLCALAGGLRLPAPLDGVPPGFERADDGDHDDGGLDG
jgi:hypothetical protein